MIVRIDEKRFGDKLIFKDRTFEVPVHSRTAILGPSGCGKTTLMRIMAGLDRDYEGTIIDAPRLPLVLFQEDRLSERISVLSNLLAVLRRLGMELEPVSCGGVADEWNQEREQWHSGANFFAIAPGKVLSYARNIHTLDELSKHGFEVVTAWDVAEGKKDISSYRRCVVTIDGSELPRGGGGARCMTMPVSRKSL